jgi:hypothetical protein
LAFTGLITVTASAGQVATSFTYQGQLKDDGIPANGNYNLVFKLFSTAGPGGSQIGPTITRNGVVLTDGLFNQTLDFGAAAFAGDLRALLERRPVTARPLIKRAPSPDKRMRAPSVAGALGTCAIRRVCARPRKSRKTASAAGSTIPPRCAAVRGAVSAASSNSSAASTV